MVTFNGFLRPNGRVGVRNHLAVIANCSCANGIINRIAAQVPEVVPLIHTYGCSIPGEFDRWRRILIGVCSNPNVYGVILVGVGCETDDAKEIGKMIHDISGMPVFAQIIQEDGGCEAVIQKCVDQARMMLAAAAECKREPVPLSQCLSANLFLVPSAEDRMPSLVLQQTRQLAMFRTGSWITAVPSFSQKSLR